MTRTGLALGGVALGPQLLAACGSDEEEQGSGSGGSGSGEDIWFDNWTEYIDTPDGDLYGKGGTLATFQEETGLKIKYTEDFNDNGKYFAKIQPLLSTGKPIGMTGRGAATRWALAVYSLMPQISSTQA